MQNAIKLWHRLAKRIHPYHTLAISFFLLIFVGTLLLYSPWSVRGKHLKFIDALFTATSATCVTGLTIYDTGSFFSRFGQIVILALIQLGGLGIMTFSSFFAYIFAGRFSLRGRDLIETTVGSEPIPYLGNLLLITVGGTLIVETIGVGLLTLRFSQDFPFNRAFYYAIFHAISAFCNAGFSLFPNNLVGYQNDWLVNLTVIGLIIVGGLGFWVFYDLISFCKNNRKQLMLHSKLVLSLTLLLTIGGAFFIGLFEWKHTLQNMPLKGKIITTLFQSITARTAGFNTLDIGSLSEGSLLVLMILMAIGASPNSTGGGIKTTTFGVILAFMISKLRSQEQVRLFNRGIPDTIVSKAIVIGFFWIVMVIVAVMTLLVSESFGDLLHFQGTMMMKLFFECFSAIGTVGLSIGITPLLTDVGKLIIILLMYVGRIGPITLALAIASKPPLRIRFAEEKIIIG